MAGRGPEAGALAAASHEPVATVRGAWRQFVRRAGTYQTRILLTLVYFVILGPSALVGRALGVDLLRERIGGRSSHWVQRPRVSPDMDWSERQF